MTPQTSTLEYHGIYLILIAAIALIVASLMVAAIRQARQDAAARAAAEVPLPPADLQAVLGPHVEDDQP